MLAWVQASAPPGDSWENMDGSHILIQDIYTGGRNRLIVVLQWSILNVNVDKIISPCHGVQGVAVLWSAVCLGNRRWLHSELAVINKMQGDCMQHSVHNNIQLIKVTTLDSRVLS